MADPFDTLGVPARFALDPALLEERHRELSRALHPDRFSGAPASERRLSLSRAIEVNDAKRALRDPVRRAEALLARAGVATGEGAEPKPAPELLMEMMELREELSAAAKKRDRHALTKIAEGAAAREAALLRRLGETLDHESLDRHRAERALPLLGELRYVRRVMDEIAALEESLAE